MEIAEHIAALRREGDLLAYAAQRTSLDAAVPTCPDWSLRDLVRHVGGIHRWAAAHVTRARSGRFDIFAELEGHWPSDSALVEWFREGHAALVSALESAPPDLECFYFLPSPSPLAFWARRQTHETGIHRADAEGADGPVTAYDRAVAVDGIDELLFGFVSRKGSRLVSDVPRIVHFHADDAATDWLVRIGDGTPQVSHEDGQSDLSVSGDASDLFLLLWNRRTANGLGLEGDLSLLQTWRSLVQIRWG
jgi:uncharacterized protein (TIGR03083 family)